MQKIDYIQISKLKPHKKNPRQIKKIDLDILCKSIKDNPEYFETRPILCNPEFEIFAGNMRYRAAKLLGLKEVPVSILDISEEKQKEIMIRDNIQNGEWDIDKLANEWDQEDLEEWGLDLPEFESNYIEDELNEDDLNMSNAKKNELKDVDYKNFDYYILSFSAGKDSVLLALKTMEIIDIDKLIFIHWDSGMNFIEEYEYCLYFANKYKIKNFIICGKKNRDKIEAIIKEKGYPFYGNLWCQTMLKINDLKSANKYIEDNYKGKKIILNGIRNSESKKRSDYPEFYKDGKYITWCPIKNFTDEDLIKYIKSKKEKIMSLYNHANRTGCAFCPNMDSQVLNYIKLNKPEIIIWINEQIANSCDVDKWRHKLEDMVKYFNKNKKLKSEVLFSDIAFDENEFDKILKSNNNITDLRC